MGGMLRRLEVQNLAVIREAALDFAPGLNVLTGETGAGKSLLLSLLSLMLGAAFNGALAIRRGWFVHPRDGGPPPEPVTGPAQDD